MVQRIGGTQQSSGLLSKKVQLALTLGAKIMEDVVGFAMGDLGY
jgi:hypothetical protein